jgi:tripartite-type tricarboxylate transporter receptor subunit TctC
VAKLNTAINAALSLPEVKTRLSGEGAYPTPSTPAVFGKLIESEVKRWGPVVKNAGIKAD